MLKKSTKSLAAKKIKSKEDLNNPNNFNTLESRMKLVIFDFDGVLYDSLAHVWSIIKPILDKRKIDISSKEEFCKLFDRNFFEAIERRLQDKKIMAQLKKEMMHVLAQKYNPPIFPLIAKVVAELSKHYILAIQSSNFKEAMHRILKRDGIYKYFSAIVGADEESSKAKRILKLLKQLSPEAVFVTDTVGDIQEAREVGIQSIAVSWGYQPYHQLKKAQPIDMAETPKELVKKIKQYFGD